MGKTSDILGTKRILIIDDNPSLVNIFAKMLRSQGFLVTTTPSLKNGLHKISTNTFDGVFVDVPISNYGEDEVLTLFNENDIFTKSNIILLSSVDITKLSKWKDYGLYSYIKKPVRRSMLLSILDHLPSLSNDIPLDISNSNSLSQFSGEFTQPEQLQAQLQELESQPEKPLPSPRGSLPLATGLPQEEILPGHEEATPEQLARLAQLQVQLQE